jgi:tetratricopeptide (TPR) repeat protein/O-antigen ligase
MKSFYKHIPIVLHTLLVVLLSILTGLLEPWRPEFIVKNLMMPGIVLIGGLLSLCLYSKLEKNDIDVNICCDLLVFLSVWTGVNILAFKTVYPGDSVRNIPDLNRLFPVFFGLGILIIILVSSKRTLNVSVKVWIVLFMMLSLPYTRPLDQHTLAMSLPLVTALYAIHRDFECVAKIFRYPGIFLFTAFSFFILSFRIVTAIQSDFDSVIPDMLFFTSLFLLFILCLSASLNSPVSFVSVFKKSIFFQVMILVLLALYWIIQTVATWGLMSILTYRLWISLLHPNALAAYLVTAIFIMAPWRKVDKFHKGYLVLSIISVFLFLLTQSRGMLAAALIGPFLSYSRHFASGRVLRLIKQRWVFVTGATALIVTGVLLLRVHYRLINSDMIQDRLTIWGYFIQRILHQPLTGFGFGSKPLLAAHVSEPFMQNIQFMRLWMGWDRLGQHFHNLYLETWWIFGIPGLALLLTGLMCAVKNRRVLVELRTATVVLMIFSLFDCPFYYPAIMVSFLTIVAIAWTSGKHPRDVKPFLSSIILRKTILCLIILVCLIMPLNAFYHRFVYALGMHYSKTDSDLAQKYLRRASFGAPRSVKAAEHLVTQKLKQGRCLDAVSFIDLFLQKINAPVIGLMRSGAWLDRNPEHRLNRLIEICDLDPGRILSENHYLDCFFASVSVDVDTTDTFFEMSVLTDDLFYADLLAHTDAAETHVWINDTTVSSVLGLRGLSLHSCTIYYPPVRYNLEYSLKNIELSLTSECDYSDNCKAKRHAFVNALLKAGDFNRATRLVNNWQLSDLYKHDAIDLVTYRDGSSDYSLIQARRTFNEGNYEQTEHFLSLSRSTNVTNPDWLYMMAVVKGAQQKWQQSHDYISAALEKIPDNPGYLTAKGIALYHLQHFTESLNTFELALRLSPWSVKARSYTGIILYEKNRFHEALTHFEQVLYLAPNDPWSWFNAYMCLNAIPGREQEAESLRDQILLRFEAEEIPAQMKERLRISIENSP